MGQPNTQAVDVECLRESDQRRGSCLNTFLIMSVSFLFVAVTAVAVGGVILVMELRSELRGSLESSRSIEVGDPSKFVGHGTEFPPVYKMQNLAFLNADKIELDNSTMNWREFHYGPGMSVGSNFNYDRQQSSMTPKRTGSYFMYLDVKLTCVHRCNAGILTLQVGNKLKCEVEIPPNSISVSKKCWTVSMIDAQEKLITQMSVPATGLKNWRFDDGSKLGMFLID